MSSNNSKKEVLNSDSQNKVLTLVEANGNG